MAQPLHSALTFFSGAEVGAPTATSASGLYALVAVSSPPVAPWRAGSYFCGCGCPRGRAPSLLCTLDSSCRSRCSTCTAGQAGGLNDRSCHTALGQAVLHVPAFTQMGHAAWHMLTEGLIRAQGTLGLQPNCVTRLMQGAVLLGGCTLKNCHSAHEKRSSRGAGMCMWAGIRGPVHGSPSRPRRAGRVYVASLQNLNSQWIGLKGSFKRLYLCLDAEKRG